MYSSNVLTFIMSGGKGQRLFPLTRDRAKPAVPFGGIYRVIDFTLSNCLNSGFHKVHVLTQYRSMSLDRHIRLGWNVFDPQVGNFIDTIPAQQRVDESWYKGTADAIYQNFHVIDNDTPEYVLILAGDHVYKMDYRNMLRFHQEKNADFTVGLVRMPVEKSRELGVCEVNGDGRLVDFTEKPKNPKTIAGDPDHFFASMGIYFVGTGFLKKILLEDSQTKSQHDFGEDIIPKIYKQFKVFAYDFNEFEKYGSYWRDIGTLDAYYEANMDLVKVTPEFDLYDKNWPIRTYQVQSPPAKTVYDGSLEASRKGEVVQSLLSQGVVVSGGKVYRSILSPNVRVNSYTQVEDSIIMEGVDVARYAKIKKAIIDKEVKIPQGEEIGYNLEKDKKRFHVTDGGITVVAKRGEV
ncbi:MAG: glucose-1-phosphate adenylyltransferase [Candidatus Omnitrophica bacterium]|nr:glucose-1-phosphate adenylyltransferase [Candidatus Omnitrophota bacterium]